MILPNSRVSVKGENVWIDKIQVSDNKIENINNTTDFKRIVAEEKDLEHLGLKIETVNKEPNDKLPLLNSGKYKVTYNQTDYFMTYLDEVDLFRRVVCQDCY
tara:strand:+ start:57 stop:362 length:306 start_codon:yes stop_codon:yes gene_type:complete